MVFIKVTNALRKPFPGAQVNFKAKNIYNDNDY